MEELLDISDGIEYGDEEDEYLGPSYKEEEFQEVPSSSPSNRTHKVPNVLSNEEYLNWLGCSEPIKIFVDDVDADLQAFVAGIMMSKGEKLDNGLTAEEFDFTLQEVTGKTKINNQNYITCIGLACFMDMSADEIDKYNKNKGNLLLHKKFEQLVYYDQAIKTFRFKVPTFLEDIYHSIQVSSTSRAKRKMTEERVKLQRLANPINRKKYMISNNFLVEIIIAVCNEKCIREVPWTAIQRYFCEMMLNENGIFKKYDGFLQLSKIRETKGNQLNENLCRELFGRGTISKALADEIYNKIKFINTPKGLILKLDGDFNNHRGRFCYGKEDFDKMEKIIQEYELMKKEKVEKSKIRTLSKNLTRKEREKKDIANRKYTYKPIELNTEDVFCPTEPFKTQTDYINERFARQTALCNSSIDSETMNTIQKPKRQQEFKMDCEDDNNNIDADSTEKYKKIERTNLFCKDMCDNQANNDCSSHSDTLEDNRNHGQLYTDEEEVVIEQQTIVQKPKEQENKSQKENVTFLRPLNFLSGYKLRKKNGSLGLADKILQNKMVAFFFGAYWSAASKEVTMLLKEVHSALKVCKEPFEVIYVSYDNSATDYDKYIKECHGDWACIEFGSWKEELIKEMFPKICVPDLVVVRSEGIIITDNGVEDLMNYSKTPSRLYKLWKEKNLYKRPIDKLPNKSVSKVVTKINNTEQKTNEREAINIKSLATKEFITKKRDCTFTRSQEDPRRGSIVVDKLDDLGIPSRRINTSNSIGNDIVKPFKDVTSSNISPDPFISTLFKSQEAVLNENPEKIPMKELFIEFIRYHVFLHRSIEGASKRYWSRMQQGLEPPFNLPQVIVGENWTETLAERIPYLQVTKTHSGDLFFDWLK